MCRTRLESMSGSYTGRIMPPGIPKTTSTPDSSRARTTDSAPLTCSGPIAGRTGSDAGLRAAVVPCTPVLCGGAG